MRVRLLKAELRLAGRFELDPVLSRANAERPNPTPAVGYMNSPPARGLEPIRPPDG